MGLNLNPSERALVLCVDEESQIQALDWTQPLPPMRPGLASARVFFSRDPAGGTCSDDPVQTA